MSPKLFFVSRDYVMRSLFLRQYTFLLYKNWIALFKHPFLNLLRCFLLPVGYAIFISFAEDFLIKLNNYGMGDPISVYSLNSQFDGSLALVWADGTDGTGYPTAEQIMSHVTSGFTNSQLNAVHQVASPADIAAACPENFNLISECFAAVAFNTIPAAGNNTTPVNYTLRADGGLVYVNVWSHTSDYEQRILPLQWAIDQAIIEYRTGEQVPTPLEWPFTQETNEQQSNNLRLSFNRGIRSLLGLALFIAFVGVSYHLAGSFASERANLLTSHMKAMGLIDYARVLSWHGSVTLIYMPAWTIVGLIWHYKIFTASNVVLILFIHYLLGLSLATWAMFVAVPFGKSPQLAAVAATFVAIIFAVLAQVDENASTVSATIFTLLFPAGYYIFALRAITGYEANQLALNVIKGDPDSNLVLLPIILAAIIGIIVYPRLTIMWESYLYDAHEPSPGFWSRLRRKKVSMADVPPHPRGAAISVRNLQKVFPPSYFKREKGAVTAIEDLTFDIPKTGIFVLLGSNGAGKSTALSIIGGLLGRSSGSITFEGGVSRPPRGVLSIVPQKNVLFPELSCYQTLKVWRAIKRSDYSVQDDDDIEQLLRDCDLGHKIHANASTLSGGQKRKLQLAIGLIGGSKIVLVDECTSGVDPLSRRALWRTLTSVRHDRTIIFTTHFLDEADLLADNIAILAAPGKLVGQGSPVALKSSLGQGYSVHAFFDFSELSEKEALKPPMELLDQIRLIAPGCSMSSPSPSQTIYHLKSKDPLVVEKVLQQLDSQQAALNISSYDILGTSIEDIFLQLMNSEANSNAQVDVEKMSTSDLGSDSLLPTMVKPAVPAVLGLTDGRARSPLSQALTIFHKRALIARRSWLSPALAVVIAIAGSCIPLFFLADRPQTCATMFSNNTVTVSLFLPESTIDLFSYGPGSQILTSPPNVTDFLGPAAATLQVQNILNNSTFISTIQQNYLNLSLGGISVDLQTGNSLVAWEASPPGLTGPAMLNLATNILYNNALNVSGNENGVPNLILANYEDFPAVNAETLVALKWIAFFGAALSVYPAFFSLYVSQERRSAVQAMQLSNGLANPIGLWLGHLLFDSIFSVTVSTIIIIVFATASNQFHGLGLLWVVLVLYGFVGALFAYCVSLFMTSPLASFAAVAGYQVVMYIIYLAAYLLTLTYAKTSQANGIITTINFTLSILSPIASVMRAAFVSVNLFSLLCDGTTNTSTSQLGDILRFGGPILYLIVYAFVLFGVLVWVDSGSLLPRKWLNKVHKPKATPALQSEFAVDIANRADVVAEANEASNSSAALRVLNVSKTFGSNKVVDDVSIGVSQDTIFALLGPNGAGKTTTFNMIRGDMIPDMGDILINGTSVVTQPRTARLSLGVCPQFTAIDTQLTVREHLLIYGRLKGLQRGEELTRNIEILMRATTLSQYADRLASELSGGNQRKLSLAIAMIGNPSVILIDEFSTGIDAKIKREMWGTLRNVAVGKAIVITTHSMEEASALANKVGIISRKMLAVGTTENLAARYAAYQVHFSCPTRDEFIRAEQLMSQIPDSRLADDVATRFEVPIQKDGMSLAHLFHVLSTQGDFQQYTVEKATLENVFLKVIRANNVLEEDHMPSRERRYRC